MAQGQASATALMVVDILNHPHGGRIARVRLDEGEMPSARQLRGATLTARGPDGASRPIKVLGFALTGGRVSDARLDETGRVDLHVQEEGEGPPLDLRWVLTLD